MNTKELLAKVYITYPYNLFRRLVVFHLPFSQRQLKRKKSLRSLRLCGEISNHAAVEMFHWPKDHQ
jgi:hypothetical protein